MAPIRAVFLGNEGNHGTGSHAGGGGGGLLYQLQDFGWVPLGSVVSCVVCRPPHPPLPPSVVIFPHHHHRFGLDKNG